MAKLITDIYLNLIEDGDAEAMNDLGALYYTGRAGEQDYEKAAYYYDMADKAGNRQATENLGYIIMQLHITVILLVQQRILWLLET